MIIITLNTTCVQFIGQISAGQPNWVEECIEGRIPIAPNLMNIVNPEEHFFLRVNGESMNKIIKNGAYALIHKQDIVENGEIAVVLVNGYDATLKKFTKHEDVVVLEPMSNDNSFQTQIYNKDTSIKILGKYIGKFELHK
jgi:repressor LexA